MAKAEVVGEVAMLVVADAAKFASDLQKKVKKAVDKVANSKTFDRLTRAAGRAGEEAGDAFSKGLDRRSRSRARDTGRKTARSFASGLAKGITAATPGLVSVAGDAIASVSNAFKTGFNLAGSGVSGIVGAISSLAASGPVGIGIAVAALVAGFLALVTIGPAVIATLVAVTAALASLVGLMGAAPAGIAILVAAFGPLILAFQGFGETIEALAEGDMEKFNESLEKLTPSARRVARELKAALPLFSQIRRIAQENFFAPLVGSVTNLVKALGPTLTRGVGAVAGAFGQLAQNLAALAADPQVVGVLDRLFAAVTRIIGAFQGPIGNLFTSTVKAVDAALPAVEKFFGRIAEGVDSFASFIDRSVEDGSFQTFLDRAFETLDLIWEIITNIGVVLADVFLDPELQTTGLEFFEAVNDALKEMHEFFQSEEGKQFLADLNLLAQEFIQTLRDVGPVVAFVLGAIRRAINAVAELIRLINLARGRSSISTSGLARAVAAAAAAGAQGFAVGGEVTREGLYRLAEGNRREVVLPVTNPARARQVADETGVTEMLLGSRTAGQGFAEGQGATSPLSTSTSEQPVFIIQIGNEQIEGFITKVFSQRMDTEVRRLMAGTRGV